MSKRTKRTKSAKRAESAKPIKLKKDKCCCGAIKTIPCVCMVIGRDCSSKSPMCPCFKLLNRQIKIRNK